MLNQLNLRHQNNCATNNENGSCKKNNHGQAQKSDRTSLLKAKLLMCLVRQPFHPKYQSSPLAGNMAPANNQLSLAAIDIGQSTLHLEKMMLFDSNLDTCTFSRPKIQLPTLYPYTKWDVFSSYNTSGWISYKSHVKKPLIAHQKSFHVYGQMFKIMKQSQITCNRAYRAMEIVSSDHTSRTRLNRGTTVCGCQYTNLATISSDQSRVQAVIPLHQTRLAKIFKLLEIYNYYVAGTQGSIKFVNQHFYRYIKSLHSLQKNVILQSPLDSNPDLSTHFSNNDHLGFTFRPQCKHKSLMHKYQSPLISTSYLLQNDDLYFTYIRNFLSSLFYNHFEWENFLSSYQNIFQICQPPLKEGSLFVSATSEPIASIDQNLRNFNKILITWQVFLHFQWQLLEYYKGIVVKRALINDKIMIPNNNKDEGKKAKLMYHGSLSMYRAKLRNFLVRIANSCDEIGSIYKEQSRYKDALLMYQYSQDIQLKVFGPNHLQIAATYDKMGFTYMKVGRFEEALLVYRKSLDIRMQILDGDHLLIATSYNNIILALTELGRYQEALSMHHELLPIQLQLVQNCQVDDISSNSSTTCTDRNTF